jgi:hypothetical protein
MAAITIDKRPALILIDLQKGTGGRSPERSWTSSSGAAA